MGGFGQIESDIMKYSFLATMGLLGAMAAAPSFGDEQIDFAITDGKVVPSESFAAMVSVLGTAISTGTEDMPVTVQVDLGGTVIEPWGNFTDPAVGDVNYDGAPVLHHIHLVQLDADTEITVTGKSWSPLSQGGSGWLEANSYGQSAQVKVLRNGDAAPNLAGWNGQSTADHYIREYLDGGTVNIHENQVIYLFELGTTSVTASYADFQDLVVLVTFGESVEALLGQFEPLYD